MNEIAASQPVSAQTLEHVLGTGDLSKLTTQQRVEYYAKTCESLGLNPLTRPMRFLSLNGQIQLYFTRDGTDQLRKAQGITLHVVDKVIEAGLFTVTVRARAKDGREDEDIGAVVLPQSGESRANALMKAMTKAKRRVTLSICGLGQTDESELDTMPGARVFDAEDELPVAPIRAAAADMPRGARVAERAPAYEAPRPHPQMPNGPVDPNPVDASTAPEKRTWAQWKDALEIAVKDARTPEERGLLLAKAEVTEIVRLARLGQYSPAKARIIELYEEIENRYLADPPDPPEPEAELPEVEIVGSDKIQPADGRPVTDTADFVRERNAMLLACDLTRAKAFFRKHNPGIRVPSDEVVEIGLHKARTGALSLPQEEREYSRRWLAQRGYQSL